MNRHYTIHLLHANALGNEVHFHGQDDICTRAGPIWAVKKTQSDTETM